MERVFTLKNGKTVDVIEHTDSVIAENRALGYVTRIYIGTDSQDKGGQTSYASCICYRSGFYLEPEYEGAEPEFVGKGVHYISTKTKLPRIRDIWSRLYKETEHTMELAIWFIGLYPLADVTLDLDYNIKPSEDSNILVSATKGWAEGLGMKVNIKLDWEDDTTIYRVQVATRAADRECRGGGSKAGNRKKFRRESKRAE